METPNNDVHGNASVPTHSSLILWNVVLIAGYESLLWITGKGAFDSLENLEERLLKVWLQRRGV